MKLVLKMRRMNFEEDFSYRQFKYGLRHKNAPYAGYR